MRGKPCPGRRRSEYRRITPADAGKTDGGGMTMTAKEDHPRGCGENDIYVGCKIVNIGSPPRMRGKRKSLFANSHGSRITPADAGKTGVPNAFSQHKKDHPRGCGENGHSPVECFLLYGSPPRMRGKLWAAAQLMRAAGITPADAGKTLRCVFWEWRAEDHPRGCGENTPPTSCS